MATPEQLLSTKGGEKMPKIKKNAEDQEPKEVGGPESDWSTADYANLKFDAAAGVKVDTTILPKAMVKAQPMAKLKAVKEEKEDGEDEDKKDFKEAKDGEDEEEVVEASDDDTVAIDGEEDIDVPAEDDTVDLELDDLADDDTELLPLDTEESDVEGDGDGVHIDIASHDSEEVEEAGVPGEDEQDLFKIEDDDDPTDEDSEDEEDIPVPEDESVEAEKMPKLEFDDEDVTEEKGDDEDDEEDEEEKDEEDEEEPVEESLGAMPMPKLKTVKEAKKGKVPPQFLKKGKKAVKEGKIRVSLKINETAKLFENNTVLTEEDKRQSRSLFESAIKVTAKKMGKQIQEAYQSRFVAAKQLHEAKVAKQVDQYLSYVVEQWAKENRIALKNQIRNKLTEHFLRGLKNLFVEHYVEVPASKVNVVEALAKNVKALKAQLAESETKSVSLHQEMKQTIARERQSLVKEHKARLIAESAGALVSSDRGKFVQRAESLRFTGTKAFRKDLVALREQYFGAKKSGERPTDVPVATPLFEGKSSSSAMNVYTEALNKISGQS